MATTSDGTGAPSLPASTFAVRAGGQTTTSSRTAARQRRQQAQQRAKVADASGTNLTTNDSSGFGLNRPYHLWGVYQTALETAPAVTTGSGTFVTLFTCSSEPQHPKLRVRMIVVNGAGTSAEVRLTDRVSGTVLSTVQPVGLAATLEFQLDATLISPSLTGAGAPMKVDVQARRTAGANTVGVLVLHAFGKGT